VESVAGLARRSAGRAAVDPEPHFQAEVEIAQGVKIRVVKSTISQVLSPTTKPAND